MIAAVQPVTDALSVLAWTTLMLFAVLLARRLGSGRRSAWALVAVCCGVVAVDKAIDLQTAFYVLAQRTVGALDPYLGLREHRALGRVVLVVSLIALVVLAAVHLARSKHAWDRAERLALLGLALVPIYVGMRLLPGMSQLVDSATDNVIELIALALIASGERLALRQCAAPSLLP
jgi:hypothetical protein